MSEEEVPWEGLASSGKKKRWNFIGVLLILNIFADFASNSVMDLVCFNRKVVFKIAYRHCKMDTLVESVLDLEPEDLSLSSGSHIY